jgi:hypothetical protein
VNSGQFKKGHVPWNTGLDSGFDHAVYKAWWAMKDRCYNEDNSRYDDYGGRGITVCERWLISFNAFADHMGPRPDGASLDRINNDGNYEPGNCRWADVAMQNRNRRCVQMVVYQGREVSAGELAEIAGIPCNTMYMRLFKYGWPVEKAASTPVKGRA